MVAWLHEHNGHRFDKAVLVNIGNAAMCFLTVQVILHHHFSTSLSSNHPQP